MRNLITLSLLVFFTASSFAQDCGASLEVEKGRSSRSVGDDGTQFVLLLTNTSATSKTFDITTAFVEAGCNKRQKSLRSTAILDVSAIDAQNRSKGVSKLTVRPGQTQKFMVDAKPPVKDYSDQWGCYEVKATSNGCTTSTMLKIYVPDSSDE